MKLGILFHTKQIGRCSSVCMYNIDAAVYSQQQEKLEKLMAYNVIRMSLFFIRCVRLVKCKIGFIFSFYVINGGGAGRGWFCVVFPILIYNTENVFPISFYNLNCICVRCSGTQ